MFGYTVQHMGSYVPQSGIKPLFSRPPSIFPNCPSASYWWNQISFLTWLQKSLGNMYGFDLLDSREQEAEIELSAAHPRLFISQEKPPVSGLES